MYLRGRQRYGAKQSSYQGGGQNQASRRRTTDTKTLNRHEKSIYNKAKKMISIGNVQAAASHLESIGMMREAIAALEDNGFVHDAAKTLLRLGIANRAGVVYARHNLWTEAAACFKQAEMPFEQAKCLEKAERFLEAGESYKVAGDLDRAAQCYEKGDQHALAATSYFLANKPQKSLEVLKYTNTKEDFSKKFSPEFLKFLVQNIHLVTCNKVIVDILDFFHLLPESVMALVDKNQKNPLKICLSLSPANLAQKLIAEPRINSTKAVLLAEVMSELAMFEYAGMIYQRANEFLKAAHCFEKFGDKERAKYCYGRAGQSADLDRLNNNVAPVSEHVTTIKDGEREKISIKTKFDDDRTLILPLLKSQLQQEKDDSEQDESPQNEAISISIQNQQKTTDSSTQMKSPIEKKYSPETNSTHLWKLDDAEYKNLLESSSLFSGWSHGDIEKIWSLGERLALSKRLVLDRVNSEGEKRQGIYFILHGVVTVYRNEQESKHSLTSGDFFGHEIIFALPSQNIRYEAHKTSECLFIPKDQLINYLETQPQLLRQFYENLAKLMVVPEQKKIS